VLEATVGAEFAAGREEKLAGCLAHRQPVVQTPLAVFPIALLPFPLLAFPFPFSFSFAFSFSLPLSFLFPLRHYSKNEAF
jgi:hypothetical protein